MNTKIVIVDTDGSLQKYRRRVRSICRNCIGKVERYLTVDGVGIVVVADPNRVVPGQCVGGKSFSERYLLIYLDPTKRDFLRKLADQLPVTLAHELHHAARRKVVGYGRTLLEAMITEGLAIHFSVMVTGSALPRYAMALNSEELSVWRQKLARDWNNEHYDHALWFFGSQELKVPRWTGYTVGYTLVNDFLERNPNLTEKELLAMPAGEFVK